MDVKPKTIMDFLKILTWQKIIQLFLFFAILLGAWGFWENRITIYNSIKVGARVESDEPLVINISNLTKSYFDTALDKSKDLISGIQIIDVNFKKNTRVTSFFAFNDIDLKKAYEHFATNKVSDVPLFTENEVNNQRLINLINGDFVCYDYHDTPAYKLYLPFPKNISYICSISIPPYYGRFSGYMNIYLTRKPENDDLVFIRQLARDMSLRIYENDIDKSKSNGGYKNP